MYRTLIVLVPLFFGCSDLGEFDDSETQSDSAIFCSDEKGAPLVEDMKYEIEAATNGSRPIDIDLSDYTFLSVADALLSDYNCKSDRSSPDCCVI